MNKFKFTIRGNDYEVEISKMEDNLATIEVNGTSYEVEIHREVKKTKTPKIIRKPVPHEEKPVERKQGGTSPVTAPLPGTIMSMNVKEGDIVKKNQVLLIMEAMKMENNVLAEKDGVIEKINVKAGDSVLQGDVLIELA
ncbi:MAG: biotin/lipoyl-containing protein [Bacteroidota bacterium]